MKDTLIKKVQGTIKLYKMLEDGDTVLVGVSSGLIRSVFFMC